MNSGTGDKLTAPAGSKNPYRFSQRFIGVATVVILGVMLCGIVVGIILGVASDSVEGQTGETLGNVALGIVIAAFALPLLVAAILGGEAIKRGAGIAGFFLIVGLVGAAAAYADGDHKLIPAEWAPLLFWGGLALMALSIIAFWVVGYIAKVPMWLLKAPVVGSPRIIVRGTSDDVMDTVLPNELDGRDGEGIDVSRESRE